MDTAEKNSEIIKKLANVHGFSFCGISKAEYLEKEAPRMKWWLEENYQAEMSYLERNFDKRLNPVLLVPNAKTVVSLMYNYFPSARQKQDTYKIAKYAYGEDYHMVLKAKCTELMADMRKEIGDFNGRGFTDSAPVMERAWAEKSGIGWIGKNGLIINPKGGSYFFLSELILDIDCAIDQPIRDYCGTCTKCVDACPTDAILPNKTINAGKCISYLTIESKSPIPEEHKSQMQDWIFGCDICQEVCPWNSFSEPHSEKAFEPIQNILQMNKAEWEKLDENSFEHALASSAMQRAGYSGLKRNIEFISDQKTDDIDS